MRKKKKHCNGTEREDHFRNTSFQEKKGSSWRTGKINFCFLANLQKNNRL